jgi:hypothetical protein
LSDLSFFFNPQVLTRKPVQVHHRSSLQPSTTPPNLKKMSEAPAAPVITNGVPPDAQVLESAPGFKVATTAALLPASQKLSLSPIRSSLATLRILPRMKG